MSNKQTNKNAENQKKSDRRKGFIQLVLVILFIVGSFTISKALEFAKPKVQKSKGGERSIFVTPEIVTKQDYQIEFKVTGSISSRSEISVVPEVSGRVTNVNKSFFAGGKFKRNEILFEIEKLDFELEVQRLQAEVAKARTNLEIEQAESAAAISEWRMLSGDKPIPALVSRNPQMKEAKANLDAAYALLKNARLDLKRASFSLPFDGSVLMGNLSEGDYVMAGQQYGKVFDAKNLEVKASLTDQQLKWLMGQENSKIQITTSHLGEEKIHEAMLIRSASSLDQQTRFATVAFGFKAFDPELVPGIFANVKVEGPKIKDVSILPASSLQKDGMIWQIKKDSTVTAIKPEIIYSDDSKIAVKNLEVNTVVAVSSITGASEGMKVKISDEGGSKE